MQRKVTFRGLSPSPAIVDEVFRQSQKLDRNATGLSSCQVVIELDSAHRDAAYRVAVRIFGAGRGPVCGSVSRAHHHEVRPALREAFGAARRQLASRGGRKRRDIHHALAHP